MRIQAYNLLPAAVICGLTAFCAAGPGYAQNLTQADSSRAARLQAQLDSLKARLEQLEKQPGSQAKADSTNELEDLLKEARQLTPEKREQEPAATRQFKEGSRSLKDLNPNVSVTGEFTFFASDLADPEALGGRPDDGFEDWTAGDDRFSLREVELGIESPLDPFTRGKFFISYADGEVDVEEGYLEWLNLPGRMNLKLGKFFSQFGQLNRWHPHAFPQSDKPRPLFNLFGEENLGGEGISLDFLLPSVFAQVNEFTLETYNPGGDSPLFINGGLDNLVWVAHLKNYYDLTPDTYLEFGLSCAAGRNESSRSDRSWLGGADLTLKWAPRERLAYRGIEWRNELFWSQRDNAPEKDNAFGFFSSLQARTGVRTILGARLDYSQLPLAPGQDEWSGSVNLDLWQSEWVFYRFQYRHTNRSYADSYNAFMFHLVWAMGPHKHETY